MSTTREVSLGQQLVDLVNEHINITEVEGDGDGVHYIDGAMRTEGEEAMGTFLMELMSFMNHLAPAGKTVYVGTNGFKFDDEPKEWNEG